MVYCMFRIDTAYRNQFQKENQKILQKVTKLRELCRNPHLFALIRIKWCRSDFSMLYILFWDEQEIKLC